MLLTHRHLKLFSFEKKKRKYQLKKKSLAKQVNTNSGHNVFFGGCNVAVIVAKLVCTRAITLAVGEGPIKETHFHF